MKLGLSIFLSTVLICSICLYYLSRDRWNWQKIFIWFGLLIAVVMIFLIGNGIYKTYIEKKTSVIKSKSNEEVRIELLKYFKPQKQTKLYDIELGESQANIKFNKGLPSSVYGKPEVWNYTGEGQPILLFVNKKIVAIISNWYFEPSFNKTEEIIMKWGEPQMKIIYDNGLRKLFLYSNYNMLYTFMKNKVIYEGIYLPEYEKEVKELILSNKIF